MKLYEHKYMDFVLKDDRIDFIWKADTADMDDYGFQYTILRYASFAMEYRIKKVLIDLTDFKFSPGEAAGKFHSDYVTKIYNMIGVTKKVFVAPFMDSKITGKEPETDYDNAFMKTYDEGVAWLNS
ncbi:hypothetical protein D1BOALGB6SA_2967 [Olavius sp. associated proteobacterium Delta 1]|nr:hypothetical protein D1BOALGB6SA_2967 [Olavius sp. associated proteobacterium Delta 1]